MESPLYPDAEKRPSAALPSSFVAAEYCQVHLTPQDCLPVRQENAAGALHLVIFEHPAKIDVFMLTVRSSTV
jgi:hypothetical protein